MAWILGYVNDNELEEIDDVGYEVVRLTEAQELSQFEHIDIIPDIPRNTLVRVWVDCDVVDLLDWSGE